MLPLITLDCGHLLLMTFHHSSYYRHIYMPRLQHARLANTIASSGLTVTDHYASTRQYASTLLCIQQSGHSAIDGETMEVICLWRDYGSYLSLKKLWKLFVFGIRPKSNVIAGYSVELESYFPIKYISHL